jgi:hypothetical protein
LKYLAALALLATPAVAGDPPTWKVNFPSPYDDAAVMVVCLRDAEHSLKCVSLEGFLAARDGAQHAAEELEARKTEQRRQWYLYGSTEL